MDNELAKKRIAGYFSGNVTREELDELIDNFGDVLTEEAYTEFLLGKFEELLAAGPLLNEPAPKNLEMPEPPQPAGKKKTNHSDRTLFLHHIILTRIATSFLLAAFCIIKYFYSKPTASLSGHFYFNQLTI